MADKPPESVVIDEVISPVSVIPRDSTDTYALEIDSNGYASVNVKSSALPLGAATAANQTNGSQKTQRVDASGNVAPAMDAIARSGYVQVSDGTTVGKMDSSTGAFEVIDYEHHEIHGGSSFHVSAVVALSSATTQIAIVTPNTTKWAHLVFSIVSTVEASFEFYEGATFTGGTGATEVNRNRNSLTTATTAVTTGVTRTGGTLISMCRWGAGKTGDENRGVAEFILKQDTTYVLDITTHATSGQVCYHLDWYEHTNL